MRTESKKIFVGLSGGVDSSVAAQLLKKEGHDVRGVFIKVWQPDFLECSWREDRRDAMRVCAKLDIPFITLDLSKEYKEHVLAYMIDEYRKGHTPNPDVMCNRMIKFGAFYRWARAHSGAIATGHYAQIKKNSVYRLSSAYALEKDQTYFLWKLRQEQLVHLHFPVGSFHSKTEIRAYARKLGLITATKPDSQGLCFVGEIDVKDFLGHFIPDSPGDVVLNGKVIGRHRGVSFYTLGERHGAAAQANAVGTPLYIVKKDISKNILIVSPRLSTAEKSRSLLLCDTNWIRIKPEVDKEYLARVRYRGALHRVRIRELHASDAALFFLDNVPLASSGQSLVLYQEDSEKTDLLECLGGGIIQ